MDPVGQMVKLTRPSVVGLAQAPCIYLEMYLVSTLYYVSRYAQEAP
jgi:hypothetical protein